MTIEAIRDFRQAISTGPVFGPFSKTCDPAVIEALGHGGFDFAILDMEHGPSSVEGLQPLVRAAELSGILPIVRVGDCEQISRALDIGAAGVQVPQVTSAEEAERVMQAARFSPRGSRGVCRYVRAADYSAMDKAEYFKTANETLVIVQLEGRAALENLDEILSVEGLDIIFVGPYDLSQALGVPGQIEHPSVIEKVQQIADAGMARDILVGNFSDTPEQARRWADRGLRYLAIAVDIGILYRAARAWTIELGGRRAAETTED